MRKEENTKKEKRRKKEVRRIEIVQKEGQKMKNRKADGEDRIRHRENNNIQ